MDSPSTSTSSPVNLSASANNDANVLIQNLNNAGSSNALGGANNLSSFGGCDSPYKIQRQTHQTSAANSRERKRIVRSAPNG